MGNVYLPAPINEWQQLQRERQVSDIVALVEDDSILVKGPPVDQGVVDFDRVKRGATDAAGEDFDEEWDEGEGVVMTGAGQGAGAGVGSEGEATADDDWLPEP